MKTKKYIFYFSLTAGRVYGVTAANYEEAEQIAKQKNKKARFIGSPQANK